MIPSLGGTALGCAPAVVRLISHLFVLFPGKPTVNSWAAECICIVFVLNVFVFLCVTLINYFLLLFVFCPWWHFSVFSFLFCNI